MKVESILHKTIVNMDNKAITSKIMKFNERADEFKVEQDSDGEEDNMMFDLKEMKSEKTS